MTKMKYLILVQGKFSDISPIGNMPDLYYLELFNNNRIIDLTPLLNCKNLKQLNLPFTAKSGGGRRNDQSYFDMRDLMEMPYYPGGTGMG